MGLGVMSHQAGLLTTLHHFHICLSEQGGNMVTTMGWGFSEFRHLFCFTLLMNKACMHHNHIPLMFIFSSPANECWVSFSFNSFLVLNFLCSSSCLQPQTNYTIMALAFDIHCSHRYSKWLNVNKFHIARLTFNYCSEVSKCHLCGAQMTL